MGTNCVSRTTHKNYFQWITFETLLVQGICTVFVMLFFISNGTIVCCSSPDFTLDPYTEILLHFNNYEENRSREIYIGGLFDLDVSDTKLLSEVRKPSYGMSELVASKVALKHINELNFLNGSSLRILYNDSKCDPGIGTDTFFDFVYRKPPISMVMGSACSDVTKTLAEIVPNLNMILISYAATSPALSEREKFKTFYRLAPTDSSYNTARTHFVRHFGWSNVGMIYQDKESIALTMNGLTDSLSRHNVTIVSSVSFRSEDDIGSKLQALREAGARILIGGFTEVTARKALCQAYNLGIYGVRHVWILVGEFRGAWWTNATGTGCSSAQLDVVADKHFVVSSYNVSSDRMSVANVTKKNFLKDYRQLNGSFPLSPFALITYDTVWTIAATLKEAGETGEYNMSSGREKRHSLPGLMKLMRQTNFEGLSGPVSFRGADRRSRADIAQIQDGRRVIVAVYDPDVGRLDFHCPKCRSITWHGGRVPRDKTMTYLRESDIDENVFLVVFVLCIIGIIVAISFLTFNLYHRKSRFIKLSSPNLNNVAVAGCIMVYIGITLLGVNNRNIHDHVYTLFCTVRAFVFAAGFSLSFGSMFTKTYRVHQIFTRANHGLIKTKLLKDKQLMLIIGTLLVIDSCVVLLWFFVDPMQRKILNVTSDFHSEDPDIIYISQISTCHSSHMEKWLGSFYAFKGLLLIFGVYMAWETRNVKIPILNDSNYIGMNVYNVVIMSTIVVVLSNLLSEKPTLAFTMESAVMLLSTSVTLCLLFVPKIYTIVTAKGNPVVASSGILVEDKTRRFIVDDRREVYYRAEVQNRVYKREIIELEQEICRLERLLSTPTEPYPVITDDILYKLPESAVDPSPEFRRKRLEEIEMTRSFSISDGGEVCLGNSDETSDNTLCSLTIHSPHIQRRMSIREVASKKLSDLRRTLSFRPQTKSMKRNQSGVRRRPRKDFESCLYQHVDKSADDPSSETSFELSRPTREPLSSISVLGSIEYLKLPVACSVYNRPPSVRPSFKEDKWRIRVKEQTSEEDIVEISGLHNNPNQKLRQLKLSFPPHQQQAIQKQSCDEQACQNKEDREALTKISTVGVASGSRPISRSLSYSHVLAKERRLRIQKLQRDLVNIQRELKDLQNLEYVITKV